MYHVPEVHVPMKKECSIPQSPTRRDVSVGLPSLSSVRDPDNSVTDQSYDQVAEQHPAASSETSSNSEESLPKGGYIDCGKQLHDN